MAALGALTLKTTIFDTLAEVGYVTAPLIVPKTGKSLQWINRVLKELVDDNKLRCIGKLGNANCYVGMRSQKTIQDVERLLLAKEMKATAWMGSELSPSEFIRLLTPERQRTAQKLFNADAPGFVDFFNQILPAVELVCFGKRANNQATIDQAWALIGEYEQRFSSIATFLRLFVDNEHVRSGRFAEAMSDYEVNNYRSAYTRESA